MSPVIEAVPIDRGIVAAMVCQPRSSYRINSSTALGPSLSRSIERRRSWNNFQALQVGQRKQLQEAHL